MKEPLMKEQNCNPFNLGLNTSSPLPGAAVRGVCLLLLAVVAALGFGCSQVSISHLHTQAGADADSARPARLKAGKFNLLPLDREEPFSEQLALDAVKANLLARGYQLDAANPDFLVAVWHEQTYQADARFSLAAPVPFGWYNPGFGRNPFWPGYNSFQRIGGYTVLNNYALMTIAFLSPESRESIERNAGNPDARNAVPEKDIYWLGQAAVKSSRNAFTVLSCLAAGILEEFPNSGVTESKSVELTRCY